MKDKRSKGDTIEKENPISCHTAQCSTPVRLCWMQNKFC